MSASEQGRATGQVEPPDVAEARLVVTWADAEDAAGEGADHTSHARRVAQAYIKLEVGREIAERLAERLAKRFGE